MNREDKTRGQLKWLAALTFALLGGLSGGTAGVRFTEQRQSLRETLSAVEAEQAEQNRLAEERWRARQEDTAKKIAKHEEIIEERQARIPVRIPGPVYGHPRVNPVVFSAPFTSSGPLIPDDANTVSHVTWNGSALVDSYANTWTQNGTVPQVSTSPLYPSGFSGAARAGAGVYSAVNYYSLGSGSDVLDFTGDFTACSVWMPVCNGNYYPLFSNGTTTGYAVFSEPNCANLTARFMNAGNVDVVRTPMADHGVNVACYGRSGTTVYLKLNSGTTASASATASPGTDTPAKLGTWPATGAGQHYDYEFWASSTAWSEANVAAIQARVLNLVADTGQTMTFTRATTATYQPVAGGLIYTAPSGVLRIESGGALIEGARTNLVIQSRDWNNAAWTKTSDTIANDDAAGIDGTTVADKHTFDTTIGETASTAFTTTASTAYRASFYLKGTAGNVVNVWFRDVTNNVYTCSQVTLTAAWARYGVSGTTGIGGISSAIGFGTLTRGACGSGTSGAVLWADGAQAEAGAFDSSVIFTTINSVARNADVLSVTNPLASSDGSWCIGGTYVPESTRAWSAATTVLASIGTQAANNSATLESNADGSLYLYVKDNAAGSKQVAYAHGFSAGSSHKVVGCSSAGTLALYVDGVAVGTGSGAGTGIITTAPGTVWLDQSNSITQFAGNGSGFKVSRSANAGKF